MFMIIPILIVFIIILALEFYVDEYEAASISAFFIIICIVTIVFLTTQIVGTRTIEAKIEMYQEENTNIETKVKETVRDYMNYEENTYKELIENADLTTLIIKYPELNSNELIKEEINLYIENNNNIKDLKEKNKYNNI